MALPSKYPRIRRAGELVLVLVALAGPWAYDRINVPAKYPCSPPFIRLEGDFCGAPLSGAWILIGNIQGLISSLISSGSGIRVSTDLIRELATVTIFLLLILPILMITALLLSGDQKQGRVLYLIGWSLALGASLLMLLIIPQGSFWLSWGAWLYAGLATIELLLEVRILVKKKKLNI